jgi:predicted molibdopterin-dependent oxidoreductase YjgC
MMIIRTHTALESLRPNSEWTVRGGIVEWLDTKQTQPTESEIQAEIIRLQAIYDSQKYARLRKAEYDQLNQFELRFDDLENGTSVWQDSINEIKTRFPK